jgi:predicted ATP-binding protein involved in virulence
MKISELSLRNYKGIENLKLTFSNQNLFVLIGENGAGKSTILSAIHKLLSELDYSLNGSKRLNIQTDDIKMNETETECEILISTTKNIEFSWSFYRSNEINTKPIVKYLAPKNDFVHAKPNISKEVFIGRLQEVFGKIAINDRKPTYLYFPSDYIPNADGFIQWYKELVLFESFLESSNKKFEFSLKEAIEYAIRKFTGITLTATIADNFKTIKPVFIKDNNKLDFFHLSDGEKRVIDIVGRIVSYFVTSFKSSRKKLLDFTGIVLIDEIEQHLHPIWQRNIIPELVNTFPKIQFIITSHSPQVITNVARQNVLIIEHFEVKKEIPHTLGRDVNSVLFDLFKLTKRPEIFQKKINRIYDFLDHEEIEKAKHELELLTNDLGENDIEIKRIQTQIDLME